MSIFVFLPRHFEAKFSGMGSVDVSMKMSSFCMCKPSNRVHIFTCRITQTTCTGVLLCGHRHLSARTADSLKDVSFLYYPQQSCSMSVLSQVKLLKGANKPSKGNSWQIVIYLVGKAVVEVKRASETKFAKKKASKFSAGICLQTAF